MAITLYTKLDVAECARRLQAATRTEDAGPAEAEDPGFLKGLLKGGRPSGVVGRFRGNRFRLHRYSPYAFRNPFMPFLHGTLEPARGRPGTWVVGEFRIRAATWAWAVGALVLFAGLAGAAWKLGGFLLPYVAALPALALAAYAAGRLVAGRDEAYLVRFVAKTLEAKVEAVRDS